MDKTPTICLNMIVKNESKIITRLLDNVYKLIDSYCICDTGSTDNTIELIESYFKSKSIPGIILQEPFVDFEYNRNFALKSCFNLTNIDYILLLDADMTLTIKNISIADFKKSLVHDAYYVFQGDQNFYYKNIRLIKNNNNFKYIGVTHEVLSHPSEKITDVFDINNVFINNIGDGGAKTDKYTRDIRLLKKGLEDDPTNIRYLFYLANSYKDINDYDNAIETYKKRIELNGWFEEVWVSYFSIGLCYMKKNDAVNAIYYWMEAYNYFPLRIENLYQIIKYYRESGKYNAAYSFYLMAENIKSKLNNLDYLFLHKDVYDYKLDYELSIVGYYCSVDKNHLRNKIMNMLLFSLPNDIYNSTLSNYKFYSLQLDKHFRLGENNNILKQIGQTVLNELEGFYPSTPSILLNGKSIIISTRYVNYKIENNKYIYKDHITSKNIITIIDIENEWNIRDEYVLNYNEEFDNFYKGLEDIRLHEYNKMVLFNAVRPLNNKMVIEHGIIENKKTNSSFLSIKNQMKTEKNWVMFTSNKLRMIYKWYPLTIGYVNNDELIIDIELPTPCVFKNVRGSTNGITIVNEIWFICHIVSDEKIRYYYHIFVVLDASTFQVIKYSPYFTFAGYNIEFTLGFIHQPDDTFLIGYSLMDGSTNYINISKNQIDEILYTV